MDKKDKNVVSVLSLAASAIALICFITGRTTLWDFLSPHSAPASAAPVQAASAAPPASGPSTAETEKTLSQAVFFVHFGHLPGHGTDDYDADDTEADRQTLVSDLETYVAAAQNHPKEKARRARAQTLLHQLGKMHPAPVTIPVHLPGILGG